MICLLQCYALTCLYMHSVASLVGFYQHLTSWLLFCNSQVNIFESSLWHEFSINKLHCWQRIKFMCTKLKRLTNTFQFVFWENLESDSVICEPGTWWTLVYGFVYLVKVSRVMALFSLTTDTVEYMAVLCGLLNVCHQRDYLWNIIPLSHPFSVWHTLHHRQRL